MLLLYTLLILSLTHLGVISAGATFSETLFILSRMFLAYPIIYAIWLKVSWSGIQSQMRLEAGGENLEDEQLELATFFGLAFGVLANLCFCLVSILGCSYYAWILH